MSVFHLRDSSKHDRKVVFHVLKNFSTLSILCCFSIKFNLDLRKLEITLGTVEVVLDNRRDIRDIICDVMTGPVEGGVVGHDEGDVDGGHNDDDVPQAF